MSVNPNDFLEAARNLGAGSQEMDFRNATSRAYYAAYHRCKPIARRFGITTSGHGDHADVIHALEMSLKTEGKMLARMLRKCRNLRRKADYGVEDEFKASEAQSCIRQVQRIFEIADRVDQVK